jgi:hypothetical protein
MRRFTLRVAVALLTFAVGLVSVSFSFMKRQSSSSQAPYIVRKSFKTPHASDAEDAADHSLDCIPAFEGHYSNYDYAYSVQIPDGMIGFGACHTNHGFGINLMDPTSRLWLKQTEDGTFPRSYLSVDASYNVDWQSLNEAAKSNMEYLKEDGASNIELVNKTRTRLSGLPAVRLVLKYDESGETMVKVLVIAFRKQGDIVYTLDLTTTALRFDKDNESLSSLQRTLVLQPLP